MSTIEDGKGSGRLAEVNSDNKLETSSISRSEQAEAAINEKSFLIGSSVVVLTTASESGILYVKNNEESDLIITGVNITSGDMSGSSAKVFLVKAYLNGTGLSAGTSVAALNTNFGSSNVLNADITAGQEGAIVTDGVAAGVFYIQNNQFVNIETSWVLPKGKTIAMSITPGTSNTVFPLAVTVEAHLK